MAIGGIESGITITMKGAMSDLQAKSAAGGNATIAETKLTELKNGICGTLLLSGPVGPDFMGTDR